MSEIVTWRGDCGRRIARRCIVSRLKSGVSETRVGLEDDEHLAGGRVDGSGELPSEIDMLTAGVQQTRRIGRRPVVNVHKVAVFFGIEGVERQMDQVSGWRENVPANVRAVVVSSRVVWRRDRSFNRRQLRTAA